MVNNRVGGVEDKIAKQADAIDNILERITVLENNPNKNSSLLGTSFGVAINNVVQEVKGRDNRSTNIVICGLQAFKPFVIEPGGYSSYES